MASRRRAISLFFVCLVAVSGVAAAATTEVTIDDSRSVPEQTTTHQGTEYTATEVRVADPGESISVSVTTTSDESYFVDIRNANDQVVDSQSGEGNRSFTFSLDDYSTGSFVVAVDVDGEYVAAHPLVVRGYEVSVDAPDRADDTLDATVETTYLRDNRSNDVDVIVGDGDNRVETDATKESSGTYTASVPVDDLPGGTYRVYGVVRGEKEAFGELELIGLSPSSTVEIEGDGSGSTGGSGGGGGSVGGTGDTATPTGTVTTTDGGEAGTTTDDGEPADETATDDGVITPADTDTPTDRASPPDGTVTRPATETPSDGLSPGFGLGAVLAALLVIGTGLLARR